MVWACAYSVSLWIAPFFLFTCTLLNQVPSIKLEDFNQVCINCKMVGGWAGGLGMRLQHASTDCVHVFHVHTLESSPFNQVGRLQSSLHQLQGGWRLGWWFGHVPTACIYKLWFFFVHVHTLESSPFNQIGRFQSSLHQLQNGWMLGWWFGHAPTACIYKLCFFFVHVHTLESSPFNQIGRFQSSLHQLQNGWRLGWWFGHAPTACIYKLCFFIRSCAHS